MMSDPTTNDPAPPHAAANQRTSRWMQTFLWLVLFALALALRLPGMSESVWIDELYTSSLFCGHPLVLAKTLFSDIHPPAYFVFMHVWIDFFGDGELALRIPPLLFGLGSLVLVQRLGAKCFQPAVGWLAAFGMALSPTHIWYSVEARPYSANVFLALLSVSLYLRHRERGWGRLGTLLLATVWIVTAWSHYYLAAIPAGFLLVDALRGSPGSVRRIVAASVAVFAAVALVLFKGYASEVPTAKSYLRVFHLREWWDLWFSWFPTGNSLRPKGSFGLWGSALHRTQPWIWAGLFVAGLAYGWRTARENLVGLLGLAAIIPIALLVLGWLGLTSTYIERSALPSMPFVFLILALGLHGMAQWLGRGRALLPLAVASLFAVTLLAFFQRGEYWTVYKPNPDWRSLAQDLAEDLPEVGPTVLLSDYVSPTALTYYDPRFQEQKTFEVNTAKWERAENKLGKLPLAGTLLADQVRRLREDWQGHLDQVEGQTRIWIQELRQDHPGQASDGEATWLLVFGPPSQAAQALIEQHQMKKGEARSYRGLTLYTFP